MVSSEGRTRERKFFSFYTYPLGFNITSICLCIPFIIKIYFLQAMIFKNSF